MLHIYDIKVHKTLLYTTVLPHSLLYFTVHYLQSIQISRPSPCYAFHFFFFRPLCWRSFTLKIFPTPTLLCLSMIILLLSYCLPCPISFFTLSSKIFSLSIHLHFRPCSQSAHTLSLYHFCQNNSNSTLVQAKTSHFLLLVSNPRCKNIKPYNFVHNILHLCVQ